MIKKLERLKSIILILDQRDIGMIANYETQYIEYW